MQKTGFVTAGTLLVAAVSATFLVAACHSSPKANGFAAAAADKAAEARLARVDTMPHLALYDEQFYTPSAEADSSAP
jgi:hypothetical protein